MSLSRPVQFPLLKLPWLCIKDVVKSWDIFDLIFFAAISKKTRRIVKSLRIPLNGIRILLSDRNWIALDKKLYKIWHFRKEGGSKQFYTSRANDALETYTNGNEVTALKMVMEFLNEVFKCSVERVMG
ncbi:unnamed protein product [Caenorhabditis brenneri]